MRTNTNQKQPQPAPAPARVAVDAETVERLMHWAHDANQFMRRVHARATDVPSSFGPLDSEAVRLHEQYAEICAGSFPEKVPSGASARRRALLEKIRGYREARERRDQWHGTGLPIEGLRNRMELCDFHAREVATIADWMEQEGEL